MNADGQVYYRSTVMRVMQGKGMEENISQRID